MRTEIPPILSLSDPLCQGAGSRTDRGPGSAVCKVPFFLASGRILAWIPVSGPRSGTVYLVCDSGSGSYGTQNPVSLPCILPNSSTTATAQGVQISGCNYTLAVEPQRKSPRLKAGFNGRRLKQSNSIGFQLGRGDSGEGSVELILLFETD